MPEKLAPGETELPDIRIMFVTAEGGPTGARAAFQRLEEALGNLRGRRFYGTFQDGEYRASVALREVDDPRVYVFETGTIPGGKYARRKLIIQDESKLGEILSHEFDGLTKRYQGKIDPNRPSVEFYRSERELFIYLPIL